MKFVPRLFVNDKLEALQDIIISKAHSNYLFNVLRLLEGDYFLAFNGKDGEWRIEVASASKRNGTGKCINQTRVQTDLPDITLYFAPIKGHRNDAIIEKATELGASNIVPIITEYTIVRKSNLEKMKQIAIEAAQQCERLCIPKIHDQITLEKLLEEPERAETLIFADESGSGRFDQDLIKNLSGKVSLLIGPEGGFSEIERQRLVAKSNVIPISLGKRVLRADTAVFAGLTLIQALCGDWK